MSVHLDPAKRHDFVYLFDVKDGNPNGDPDAGNLPRVDPETMHGLVTDVALKRKIRDYVDLTRGAEPRFKIFVQSKVALNALITRAYVEKGIPLARVPLEEEVADIVQAHSQALPQGLSLVSNDDGVDLVYDGSLGKSEKEIKKAIEEVRETSEELAAALQPLAKKLATGAKERKKGEGVDAARGWLIDNFYDIRMFGAVLSVGLNAGQVRGPVQMTFGRSVDPVTPLDLSITRVAITREEDKERKDTEMGRKPVVPYGLYRAHGFYSPFLGRQTGATAEDLEVLWEALIRMFEFDRSASRGEMACRGLYIFSHDSDKGNVPAHKLFEKVRTDGGVDAPRSFADYRDRVRVDLPDGVTLGAENGSRRVRFSEGVTLTVLAEG